MSAARILRDSALQRTVDRERLRERLGALSDSTMTEVLGVLGEMFER